MSNRKNKDDGKNKDVIENVFDDYDAIIVKLTTALATLKQATDMTFALSKKIRDHNELDGLFLTQRLCVKIVFNVFFSFHRHLDRLLTRMNTCARIRQDVIDIDSSRPAFE